MKIILLISTLLLVAAGAAYSRSQPVQEGSWPDGTKVLLQCPDRADGVVRFIFVSPEGKEYPGMFSCGKSI